MDLQPLIDHLTALKNGLRELFLGAYETVYDLLIGFYCWLFVTAVGFACDSLDLIAAAVPEEWVVDMGAVLGYAAALNAWVPVDVALALIVGFYTFRGAVLIYRVVKSWIPTVSG